MRRAVTLAGLLLALAVAGCGGDDDEGGSTQPTTGPGAAAVVPDVSGMQLLSAAEQFADQGLRVAVEYVPSEQRKGNVIGQERPAGTELQRGDTVGVTVSEGPSPAEDVGVPAALDQTSAEGEKTLKDAGLAVHTIRIPAVVEDVVVYHTPAAGTNIPRGALVILYAGGS